MNLYSAMLLLFGLVSSPCLAITVDCAHPGTGDYDSIGTALAASSQGGVINISPGVCHEDLLYVPSDVTLSGAGWSTIIKSHGAYAVKIWNQGNVTIQNLRIVSDPGNIIGIEARNTRHLVIANVEITGTGPNGDGVSVFGGKDIDIHDNHVMNAKRHGISTADLDGQMASSVSIVNNAVEQTTMSCINVSETQGAVVSGNQVSDCGSENEEFGGVRISNHSKQIVIQSNIINRAARGIFVTTGSEALTISGNQIDSSLIHGLLIENVKHVTVNGNLISKTLGNDGEIRVAGASKDIAITGNSMSDGASWGIRVAPTEAGPVTIVGNQFICEKRGGIAVDSGLGASVTVEANHEESTCP